MSQAITKSNPQPVHPESQREVPTFVATDLLEKLIADRDARAVDRMVAARRH